MYNAQGVNCASTEGGRNPPGRLQKLFNRDVQLKIALFRDGKARELNPALGAQQGGHQVSRARDQQRSLEVGPHGAHLVQEPSGVLVLTVPQERWIRAFHSLSRKRADSTGTIPLSKAMRRRGAGHPL